MLLTGVLVHASIWLEASTQVLRFILLETLSDIWLFQGSNLWPCVIDISSRQTHLAQLWQNLPSRSRPQTQNNINSIITTALVDVKSIRHSISILMMWIYLFFDIFFQSKFIPSHLQAASSPSWPPRFVLKEWACQVPVSWTDSFHIWCRPQVALTRAFLRRTWLGIIFLDHTWIPQQLSLIKKAQKKLDEKTEVLHRKHLFQIAQNEKSRCVTIREWFGVELDLISHGLILDLVSIPFEPGLFYPKPEQRRSPAALWWSIAVGLAATQALLPPILDKQLWLLGTHRPLSSCL